MVTLTVLLLIALCFLSSDAFQNNVFDHRVRTPNISCTPSTSLFRPLTTLNTAKHSQISAQPAQRKFPLKLTTSLLTVGALLMFQRPAVASIISTLQERAHNSGFIQAFLLIFVSELGDKTFFIAGLLAAKYGRLISFSGSIGALGVMTIISTLLGQIFHAIPSSLTQGIPFDDYIAVGAFSYFGLKTLYDSSRLKEDNVGMEEEKAEAEEIVGELTKDQKRKGIATLVMQVFTLIFAAEIGDRSFLSTIALSAAMNPFSVASGALAAHASATGIAVIGGSFISKYLSEKVIGYISGALFLLFAFTTGMGIF